MLRDTTLLFLVKRTEQGGPIDQICLAMKKRGFGMGRWNGAGGKLEPGESITEAAIRETQEEIGCIVKDLQEVAQLEFRFANKPDWDQLVHVFIIEEWQGEPQESEEMQPEWFAVKDIPFAQMWPDDPFWLPLVLNGEKVKAKFTFGEGDTILDQEVNTVQEI